MTNPLQHLRNRLREEPLTLHQRLANKVEYLKQQVQGSPLPPTRAMFLVQGNHSASDYVSGGLAGWQTITETLHKSYQDINRFRRVLDFGCGCGRVLRHWKPYSTKAEIHGTDYNPELVMWAQKTVPFAKVGRNQLEPPTGYANNSFDFIYAFSIFTHWTAELQKAWAREFQRILSPGGLMIMTFHGDFYVPFLIPAHREQFLAGRIVTGLEDVGSNACSAYNPFVSVQNELLQGLELLNFYPRSARGNPWQDVYLVRKPA